MEKLDCKFGSKCFKLNKGCPFNHDKIDAQPIRECRYGMACQKINNGCTLSHTTTNLVNSNGFTPFIPTKNCNFGQKCQREVCTFLHPDGRYKDGTCLEPPKAK